MHTLNSKMSFVYFPPTNITFKTIPNFLMLTHKTTKLQTPNWKQEKHKTYPHVQTLHITNTSSFSPSKPKHTLIPLHCKENSSEEGTPNDDPDCRALEIVLKLYSAIKNRDLQVLSDVIGEECRCMSNFVSGFKPLQGKQQVLEFFMTLMRVMGNSVEFVIQPTTDDGTNVGLQWTLTCSKTHAPLSKGFSFYTTHSYKGKLVIRNVEMFMEPILHIEPVRLMLIVLLSKGIAQMCHDNLYKKKMKGYLLLLICLLMLIVVSIVFIKFFLH